MNDLGSDTAIGGSGLMNPIFTVPERIEHRTPSAYRPCRKKDGRLVLQGAYEWEEGAAHGYEWRDIPEVQEE